MTRFFRLLSAALVGAALVLSMSFQAQAADPMDINTATKAQLMTLEGVGEARSDAIMKGRPYKAKNELVDKNILPQAVYDKIKDQIIAKQVAATPPKKG